MIAALFGALNSLDEGFSLQLAGFFGSSGCNLDTCNNIAILFVKGHTASMGETRVEAPQLPKHKVKYKIAFQRACNEKDEKGKICGGHLKRWFYKADVLEQACGDVREKFGDNAEIYRCEHCRTLYLPTEEEPTGRNVAGLGKPSVFGLTLGNKDAEGKNKA